MRTSYAELPYKKQTQVRPRNKTYNTKPKHKPVFYVITSLIPILLTAGTILAIDYNRTIIASLLAGMTLIAAAIVLSTLIRPAIKKQHRKHLQNIVEENYAEINNYLTKKYEIERLTEQQIKELLLGEQTQTKLNGQTITIQLANTPDYILINPNQPFKSIAESPKANYYPPLEPKLKV